MSRFLFAAIALGSAVGIAAAQPAKPAKPTSFDDEVGKLLGQPAGLTADAAAARAAKASTTARRKAAELAEARAKKSSVSLILVPRTTLSAGYTRLSEVEAPPGLPITFPVNTYQFGAEVAVPLTEIFVRVPRARSAAERGIDAAAAGARAAEVSASSDARVAYYEWVRAELQEIVAERLLVQVTANLTQIRNLAEVQRVSRGDVLRIEAQRAQAELTVAQVRQAVALRAEQLRIAIGAGPGEALVIGEDVRQAGEGAAVPEGDALLRTALDRRLELDAIDAAMASLRQQRKVATVDRLPSINLFAQGNYDKPNQRNLFGPPEFSFSWAAGVRATWSLNGFLEAGPKDTQLAAQQRALAADRAGLELGIRAELTAAREAVILAEAAAKATQQGLAAAEESYRVRQELLAAGRATAIELVDAETELTRARVAAMNALIDRRVAWAQLRHATGEDIR